MKAILYARVSTKNDDSEAKLQGQIDLCTQYAVNKDYVIVDSVCELAGISGKETDRPELNKILFRSDFDILVCRDLDRLSRDNYALGYFERALGDNGVSIEFVNQTFDDSPSGELHKDMVSSFSKFERKMIAYRTRMGRYRSIKAGNVYCRMSPYGYDKAEISGKKTLIINENEAETIRLIFDLCLDGQSTYQIADYLTSNHIPTRFDKGDIASHKQRSKNEWCATSVLHILQSKLIGLGEWSYTFKDSGETLTVAIPPIVSKQAFYSAQEQIRANKKFSKNPQPNRYLLSGMVKCSHCEYRMGTLTKTNSKKIKATGKVKHYDYAYYRCVANFRNRPNKKDNCPTKSFPADKIEAIVWQTVKGIFSNPDELYDKLIDKLNNQTMSPELKRLNYLNEQIADSEAELKSLVSEWRKTSGKRTKALLKNDIDELEASLEKLDIEKDILAAKIDDTPLLDIERIDNLVSLARVFEDELEYIEGFETKRKLIKSLGTQVYIGQIDNGYTLKVVCYVSESTFELDKSLSVLNKSLGRYAQETQPIILEIGYVLDMKLNVVA